jgi:hypothetical protein
MLREIFSTKDSRPRPAAGRKKALFAAKARKISQNFAKSR